MKMAPFSRLTATAALFCLLAGIARAEPVTLIFAGDIMLADGPGRSIASGGDPLAPFATILSQADYRIGNLECPVATGGQPHASKIATFRAEPPTLSVLRGRFDAVSLANNHSGDYGHAAFLETMTAPRRRRHRLFRRRPQPRRGARTAVDREARV